MVTRNERNAIIQHGTMTMVRRSVLEQVGRWGVSTITEDTELGLRIFEQGHEAVYIDQSYGHGLIPDTFTDYKKQRHRWAYGAMQILREHAGQLLGTRPSKLSAGQRYHFVAGWLPWIADGINLIFTLLAVLWSGLMLFDPLTFNAPPLLISVVPIMFLRSRSPSCLPCIWCRSRPVLEQLWRLRSRVCRSVTPLDGPPCRVCLWAEKFRLFEPPKWPIEWPCCMQ